MIEKELYIMKFKKMFIFLIMALLFTSCESGFEDMMNETKGEKAYKYYAYVANSFGSSVSAYSIDADSGALTSIDTYTVTYRPMHLTTDPANKFLYVACAAETNPGAGFVYAYSINGTTGALTLISSYSTGANSRAVTVDPDGKYLYVANGRLSILADRTVMVYAINSDGALTYKTTIDTNQGPCSIAVDPANKFLYILESYAYDILAYTIGDGTYISIGTYTASPGQSGMNYPYPKSIAITPSGKYTYSVYEGMSGGIYVYAVDSSTGALGSRVSYEPGYSDLNGITIHPGGKFVYVTASGGNDGYVLLYTADADTGVLTYVSSTSVSYLGSTSPNVDPSGKFLYITNWNSANVGVYSIDPATGALTEISGSPFAAGSSPRSITLVKRLQ